MQFGETDRDGVTGMDEGIRMACEFPWPISTMSSA